MPKNKDRTISKKLYTLLIDYDGASFVTQARSKSFAKAAAKCIKKWHTQEISNIVSDADKAEIIAQLDNETLVPVSGMTNVWCGSVLVNNKLMLLNLIRTKKST